jgi:hypothetical protein
MHIVCNIETDALFFLANLCLVKKINQNLTRARNRSFEQGQKWTNLSARNSGPGGGKNPKYPTETKRNLGLHGYCPPVWKTRFSFQANQWRAKTCGIYIL